VGPSGFMLFRTSDHGALLRLAGQTKKAVQYLLGNPLFAVRMTQYDIRAGLYAPLRVFVYEDEGGKTCVEYDRPSSLFGQFGNAGVTEVATMLDRKLEQLVAESVTSPVEGRAMKAIQIVARCGLRRTSDAKTLCQTYGGLSHVVRTHHRPAPH